MAASSSSTKKRKAGGTDVDDSFRKAAEKIGMIVSTIPTELQQQICVEPSARVKSNHRALISKGRGTAKNRHLFILPGLLQTDTNMARGKAKRRKSSVGGTQGREATQPGLSMTQELTQDEESTLQIGSISNLDSPNPVLHLKMDGGVLRLLGSIYYPKYRFISLQCKTQDGASGNGPPVELDNTFDNVVIFSKASWVSDDDRNEGKPFPPPVDIPSNFKVPNGEDQSFSQFIQTGPVDSKDLFVPKVELVAEKAEKVSQDDGPADNDEEGGPSSTDDESDIINVFDD